MEVEGQDIDKTSQKITNMNISSNNKIDKKTRKVTWNVGRNKDDVWQ